MVINLYVSSPINIQLADPRMDTVILMLQQLTSKEIQVKMDLDDLVQKATDEKTVIESGVVLLTTISDALKQALASGDSAKIQAVADLIDSGKAEMAAALVANTPAALPASNPVP